MGRDGSLPGGRSGRGSGRGMRLAVRPGGGARPGSAPLPGETGGATGDAGRSSILMLRSSVHLDPLPFFFAGARVPMNSTQGARKRRLLCSDNGQRGGSRVQSLGDAKKDSSFTFDLVVPKMVWCLVRKRCGPTLWCLVQESGFIQWAPVTECVDLEMSGRFRGAQGVYGELYRSLPSHTRRSAQDEINNNTIMGVCIRIILHVNRETLWKKVGSSIKT